MKLASINIVVDMTRDSITSGAAICSVSKKVFCPIIIVNGSTFAAAR